MSSMKKWAPGIHGASLLMTALLVLGYDQSTNMRRSQ